MSKNNPVGSISKIMPALTQISTKINKLLKSLSDEELDQLKNDIDNATEINCAWNVYEISKGIKDIVENEIRSRLLI